MSDATDAQTGTRVVSVGAPLERGAGQGRTVVLAIHGRDAAPENILDLVPRLAVPDVTDARAVIAAAAGGVTEVPGA